jgi:hypothetical protein
MERDIIAGKTYKHISGKYYRVLCIANDSENHDGLEPKQLVIYETLGNKRTIWSRSYDLFNEKVDKSTVDSVQKYRFELVDDEINFGDKNK